MAWEGSKITWEMFKAVSEPIADLSYDSFIHGDYDLTFSISTER